MNIRDHIRAAITEGLAAHLDQRAGQAGIVFHDENEFIPFDDLNVNPEYGYFRISQFPDIQRDCTNENPETLHYGKDFSDGWKPLIWADSGGNLMLVGDIWQAADLYQALKALLEDGAADPEEISENDASWGYMKRLDWAVAEYRDYIETSTDNDQVRNTIKAAAKRGAIWGCSQDERGNWYFRPAAFRGWLVKTRDEKRGRPRSQPAEPAVQPASTGDPKANRLKVKAGQYQVGDQIDGRVITGFGKVWAEATLSGGQLWQECEYGPCQNEPVCVHCFKCEKHCHCDTVEYCYAYFS